ncbi:hypothetical protein FRY74_02525 [Vicingus serpentipes]|jgi:hypothetical protein|uniref:Cytochrome c n=1 Tax=Vicingus serpentipes TaxID=1926625 RepID=A0A5C6RZ67_9FLAO|nr:hypothetical protein [Vicingus serpentipes]TXB67079.1 hypothetical protein FRY74_02525 [Vicingus serpentipes]
MKLTNFIIPIFIGIFSFLFVACESEVKQKEVIIDASQVEVSETNPNGDSELALLMRKMFEEGEDIKKLITNNEGNITEEYIAELERIHTATPTDADVKTPEFEAYTKLMIDEANLLFSNDSNRVQGFNNLVNRCINCHQSFCPGPIKRIKKLTIN